MLSSVGALRNWNFEDFSIESNVPNAKGWLLTSDWDTGNNQDLKFKNVEWLGAWDYGIRLTGDAEANLNSEMVFRDCAFGNSASFAKGWFVSGDDGVSDPEGDGSANVVHAQEDQFLNYWFENCKFEASHGRYIVLNRGGNVHIVGGSWMHTGSAGTPTRGSTGEMIYIPISPVTHFDGAQMLSMRNVRTELRSAGSAVLDVGWTSNGTVTFENCGDNAKAYEFTPGLTEGYAVRNGCWVDFNNCIHGAYVGLYGASGNIRTQRGKMSQGLTKAITDFSGTGHVRRASGTGGSAAWVD
jgi:hypothetical protein